jgi:PAS domain S-box-containing protein
MHISPARKVSLAVGLAVVALGIGIGAVAWSVGRLTSTADRVEHTHIVIERLGATLSDLQDVETGVRGYVITGDTAFLAPYDGSVIDVQSRIAELRALTSDNPHEQQRLDVLESLATQRISIAVRNISLRREQGFEPARASVASGEGKAVMDQFRAVMAVMIDEERGLLAERSARNDRTVTAMYVVVAASILLAVSIVALAALSISRQIRARQRAVADLDRFFAVSPDMLATADFNGYFTRLNPMWSDTLGWTVGELLHEPYINFVHPDDRDATLAAAVRQTGEGKPVISFNNRYRCKDGSYRWLQWSSAPSRDRLFASARDITPIRETETALRDSGARYRSVIDNMAEGVIVIDQRGRVESFNGAAERIFAYQASEVIGQDVNVLMPEPYHSEHDQYLRNYVNGGPKKVIGITREAEGRRKDGERFPMDLAISEIVLGDQRAFVGIVRDISDRKRAETALRDLNETLEQQVAERTAVAEQRTEQLVQINGELEAFTYSVSHDLKEPLRTLEAFSQFLLEDYADKLDAVGKDHLTRLAQASARMKHLIEDLLAISRAGRKAEPAEPVAVERLIAAIVQGMRITLHERGAAVDVASDLPKVLADPRRIEQIFGNLIANGIKFNRSPTPRVEIGTFVDDGGDTVFFVRDNGIGIEPQYYEKIFGVFQRLHRREEFEGTGAGLAIVKRAVEALGGRIWVESIPGEGSAFMFTLPVSPAQAAAAAAMRDAA